MKASQPEIEKILALLAETPRRIAACTSGGGENSLHSAPGRGQWSAADILAHLRACEELWSYSIYAMLSQESPTLALLDERKWVKASRYADQPFQSALQVFTLRRIELLHVLRELPFEAWSRSADIGGRTHTVFSQVRRMALHEQEHCQQFEALYAQSDDKHLAE